MLRHPDHFEGREIELVQISRRLREAKRVEAVLTEQGIDYTVMPEPFRTTFLFLFPVERIGAFFYVPSEIAESTRILLREAGFQVQFVE